MNASLEEIERNAHKQQISAAQVAVGKRECCLVFLLGFLAAPFFCVTFLFIPLIGQLLVGLALIVTLYYFKVRHSWSLFFLWVFGALLSCGSMVFITSQLHHRVDLASFVLLALGLPFCICYIIALSAQMWRILNMSTH